MQAKHEGRFICYMLMWAPYECHDTVCINGVRSWQGSSSVQDALVESQVQSRPVQRLRDNHVWMSRPYCVALTTWIILMGR